MSRMHGVGGWHPYGETQRDQLCDRVFWRTPSLECDTLAGPQGDHHVILISGRVFWRTQVSSADTMGGPQGDQHTTMSASTAMLVENGPSAMQRTNRANLQEFRERYRQTSRSRIDEAEEEINLLRAELSRTPLHLDQLQQLLAEDQESHPSNRQAPADRAQLITVKGELLALHSSHWIASKELEKSKAIQEQLTVQSHAQARSILNWKKSFASLQKQLEPAKKEIETLTAAITAKESLRVFEKDYYDEFLDETHHTRQNIQERERRVVFRDRRDAYIGTQDSRRPR